MGDLIDKVLKRMRAEVKLLEDLFVVSLEDGNDNVPGVYEFALSEVVNGTVVYIGGDAGKVQYREQRYDRNFREIYLNILEVS